MLKNLLLFLFLVSISFCKKKEEEKKPEPPAPTGRNNIMTAKVNGANWAVKGNQTPNAEIEQATNTDTARQYVFIGTTGPSSYSNSIFLFTRYATGIVDLRSGPGNSAIYFDPNGRAHYIHSGTMTITVMDTSHVKSPHCDKFKANFSFVTDSVSGTRYTIEEGIIDFEAQ